MAANADNVFAGGLGSPALCAVAPLGTPMPSTALATPNVAFLDPGWVGQDGLKKTIDEESQEIYGYGSDQPIRILRTKRKASFDILFLETTPLVMEIYNRLPLNSIVLGSGGEFDWTEGPSRSVRIAGIFTIVDGDRLLRGVIPQMEVTASREWEAKAGAEINYGVTFTAYPGSDGTAIHWYAINPALAA